MYDKGSYDDHSTVRNHVTIHHYHVKIVVRSVLVEVRVVILVIAYTVMQVRVIPVL